MPAPTSTHALGVFSKSELEAIVDMCERHAPYLEKNGLMRELGVVHRLQDNVRGLLSEISVQRTEND